MLQLLHYLFRMEKNEQDRARRDEREEKEKVCLSFFESYPGVFMISSILIMTVVLSYLFLTPKKSPTSTVQGLRVSKTRLSNLNHETTYCTKFNANTRRYKV